MCAIKCRWIGGHSRWLYATTITRCRVIERRWCAQTNMYECARYVRCTFYRYSVLHAIKRGKYDFIIRLRVCNVYVRSFKNLKYISIQHVRIRRAGECVMCAQLTYIFCVSKDVWNKELKQKWKWIMHAEFFFFIS